MYPKLADVATIKARADLIGVSLKKLAEDCGVAPTTVYRALRGEADIGVGKLSKLNRELRRREGELLHALQESDGAQLEG